MQTSSPDTPCPICGQQFSNLANYQRHVPVCESRAYGDMHNGRTVNAALRIALEDAEWRQYMTDRLQQTAGLREGTSL